MTAMIRNLGKMTSIELLKPLSSHAATVSQRLKDETLLRKARIHPFNVLVALKTYEMGHGEKGKLKWQPNQTIVQALDDAFYMSFKVSHNYSLTLMHCLPTQNECLVLFPYMYVHTMHIELPYKQSHPQLSPNQVLSFPCSLFSPLVRDSS